MAKPNTLRQTIDVNEVENNKKTKFWNLMTLIRPYVFKFLLYFFSITIGLVVVFKFVPVCFTLTMLDRKIEAMNEDKDTEIYHEWVSVDETSKEVGLAVVAAEDQIFPDHWGFDFEHTWYAFRSNMKGKKIRGASTISQQVAKNVFLWQGRSYIRKILEAYFTVLIELIWGKERILEVYLNVAEMGNMTFGVEAAAKRYYGKNAINLNRTESARIAAVLPNPRKFSIAKPSGYVQRRTNQIARQMRALGGKNYVKEL